MPIVWTQDAEANRLLEEDPLALMIGLVLDQQVPMEKAFMGPKVLKQRLGRLDARELAAMDPDRLDAVFRERPAIHRFPGSMARRVQAFAQAVTDEYGGDTAAIWRGVDSGDELARRIGRLPGFGDMKTRITIAVLAKKFGVRPQGWENHAANWHTVADVEDAESMQHARDIKKQMKAEGKA